MRIIPYSDMLYLLAPCKGSPQSSPVPPLLGCPASAPGSSPSLGAPTESRFPWGATVRAYPRVPLLHQLTQTAGFGPAPRDTETDWYQREPTATVALAHYSLKPSLVSSPPPLWRSESHGVQAQLPNGSIVGSLVTWKWCTPSIYTAFFHQHKLAVI